MSDEPFIGSEAVYDRRIRKHELRTRYRAVFPDVYVGKDMTLTLHQRAVAAWLWSHRQGIIAGTTAAALHGAKWVPEDSPIDLICPNARRPRGIRTSDNRMPPDETGYFGSMRITTVPRTAFDLGRRGRLGEAVARLDALGNATRFSVQEVLRVADRHRGARQIRQLRTALDVFDPGAESPKETWLRLLLIGADFPRPETQIPVLRTDGRSKYYLDMGWEDLALAVEYDGDHHRTDPIRYAYDIKRAEELADLGWKVVRVIRSDRQAEIVRRVSAAWSSRLRRDYGFR